MNLNWLRRRLGLAEKKILKTFSYGYQKHPFDDGRARFEVKATSIEEADQIAQEKFALLVANHQTVMRNFFLAT